MTFSRNVYTKILLLKRRTDAMWPGIPPAENDTRGGDLACLSTLSRAQSLHRFFERATDKGEESTRSSNVENRQRTGATDKLLGRPVVNENPYGVPAATDLNATSLWTGVVESTTRTTIAGAF
jgi:hypothetical protein